MNYNVSKLFSVSNCRVVFAENMEIAKAVENAVFAEEPKYAAGINPALAAKKKLGPFTLKNKNILWNILSKTKIMDNKGSEYLKKQLKALNLYPYAERFPAELSIGQLQRASILYDALEHKKHFLINDYTANDKSNGQTIANWMKESDMFELVPCEYIWITDMSKNNFKEKVKNCGVNSDFYTFFTVLNNNVVKIDFPESKVTLKSEPAEDNAEKKSDSKLESLNSIEYYAMLSVLEYQKELGVKPGMTPEEMYEEGRKYDIFSSDGPNTGRDESWKAIDWYERASVAGSIEAQNRLGMIYQYGLRNGKKNYEAALYWYALALTEKDYDPNEMHLTEGDPYHTVIKSMKEILRIFPEGVEMVRERAGEKAEALIKDVENE